MSNAKLVIAILGGTVLLGTLGIIWLSHDGINPPDVLQALAVGALGALSSLLAKTSDTQLVALPPADTEGEHKA
jgi:hypothetical protein